MIITPELSAKLARAGRIGGAVTLARHGMDTDFYSRIGRLGGRPRSPAIAELLADPPARSRFDQIKKQEDRLPRRIDTPDDSRQVLTVAQLLGRAGIHVGRRAAASSNFNVATVPNRSITQGPVERCEAAGPATNSEVKA